MNNMTYDRLKPVVMKWMYFLIAVFAIIVENWDIPYGNTILATASGIAGVIGTYLGVSGNRYWETHTVVPALENALESTYTTEYIDEEEYEEEEP